MDLPGVGLDPLTTPLPHSIMDAIVGAGVLMGYTREPVRREGSSV